MDMAARVREQTGEGRAAEFLKLPILIEIQRGNAASVMATVDKPKSCDELFFLLG